MYLVSRDGRPIYYFDPDHNDAFDSEISDVTLFSGLISAIQGVMKEIDAGEISNFDTEKNKIFIKNHKQVAFVIVLPLSVKYSHDQIDLFVNKLIQNIPINLTNLNLTRTSSEDAMLNTIVTMLYNQWLAEISESKASRKLKEDLW